MRHKILSNSFCISLLCFLLNACAVSGNDTIPASNFYCDKFLIYDMCAHDLDSDGVVEHVFFEDTNEVFLYREGTEPLVPSLHVMHDCALPMNNDIIDNTSKLFYISDETSLLERTDIRGSLMLSYVSFMPRVASCAMSLQEADREPDEFDFEIDF